LEVLPRQAAALYRLYWGSEGQKVRAPGVGSGEKDASHGSSSVPLFVQLPVEIELSDLPVRRRRRKRESSTGPGGREGEEEGEGRQTGDGLVYFADIEEDLVILGQDLTELQGVVWRAVRRRGEGGGGAAGFADGGAEAGGQGGQAVGCGHEEPIEGLPVVEVR
jgi:hypothetical protein